MAELRTLQICRLTRAVCWGWGGGGGGGGGGGDVNFTGRRHREMIMVK